MPDRGGPLSPVANWRGSTYLFGAPQNEQVSPPTYLSKGLASAPPRALPRSTRTEPREPRTRAARAANPRHGRCAGCRARGGARSDARGGARRSARHVTEPGKHHHDVTVSRSFVAPCRAEPRPTYLFGPLVVVVKCDLPTYPDGATGDNGPPIGQVCPVRG